MVKYQTTVGPVTPPARLEPPASSAVVMDGSCSAADGQRARNATPQRSIVQPTTRRAQQSSASSKALECAEGSIADTHQGARRRCAQRHPPISGRAPDGAPWLNSWRAIGRVALVLGVVAGTALAAPADGSPGAGSADSVGGPRALPQPPQRPRPSRAAVDTLIDHYARRHGLELDLVHAVVRAESAYDAHAVSPAGAVGLMQIMPETAADYGVRSVAALFDADTNVRIGTRHLKRLVSRYGIGKAVMAYNAGEGALARHGGFVTFAETQRYTHRVLTSYLGRKGVDAYSSKARRITGITLSPAMADAGAGKHRGLSRREQARRMRGVDFSSLSLKVRPSLSDRALDPAALEAGPESQPMFVLERPSGNAQ